MNCYQSKNHKQCYKIKKLLYKSIGKCRIKTPRGALRLRMGFLTVRGRLEWIILAVAFFILFLFCNEPAKKNYNVRKFTAEPPRPSSHTSQHAFTWTTPPPSERTHFMDDSISLFFMISKHILFQKK